MQAHVVSQMRPTTQNTERNNHETQGESLLMLSKYKILLGLGLQESTQSLKKMKLKEHTTR